jgi:ZIP family zinc transporter
MELAILTALGVGGATVIGACFGFIFGKISARVGSLVLGFCSGVMLAAAFIGLIIPALGDGELPSILTTSLGITVGALILCIIEKLLPSKQKDDERESGAVRKRALLFVLAIAIHNLPEGIAAGVGFGLENTSDALLIAGAIALQNLPEGMVIIAPMLAAGISRGRTFFLAFLTGLTEVVGTMIGYFASSLSYSLMPFLLALAGGTMIFVVCDDMIPEASQDGEGHTQSISLIIGSVAMIIFGALV